MSGVDCLLTAEEVAELLRVTRGWIYAETRAGRHAVDVYWSSITGVAPIVQRELPTPVDWSMFGVAKDNTAFDGRMGFTNNIVYVVAYDIPDDRRRNRVFKALKRFGLPVQYSVFECFVTQKQFSVLLKTVDELIVPGRDSVMYYEICKGCHGRIVTLGAMAASTTPKTIVC